MARRVIWSYEAAGDLDALAEYIRRDSSFYAAAFTREVLDAKAVHSTNFLEEAALSQSLAIRKFVNSL